MAARLTPEVAELGRSTVDTCAVAVIAPPMPVKVVVVGPVKLTDPASAVSPSTSVPPVVPEKVSVEPVKAPESLPSRVAEKLPSVL